MKLGFEKPLGRTTRRPYPVILLVLLISAMLGSLGLADARPASAAPQADQPINYLWSTERADASRFFDNLTNRSMAVDTSGYPHMAYGGDHLYHAWFNGTNWIVETVDSSFGVGLYAAIDIDKNNHPHISYYDTANGALKYAYHNGSAWVISTIDQRTAAQSEELQPPEDDDFALEDAGREWQSRLLQDDFGGALAPEGIQVDPGVGQYTSIVTDGDNDVHISYFDEINGDLKYASNSSGAWVINRVDSNGKVGKYTSIDVDDNDRPHISYFDESNDNLKYARISSGDWVRETVDGDADSEDNTGGYTSIALDGSDRPNISYYDATDGNLRHARKSNGVWTLTTVDSTDDIGGFTSLVLDSNGYARISYVDFTDDDLKYAALQRQHVE